jgi:hypothetical protein
MASTATKQPGKQRIKHFASCINFLWALRLSLWSSRGKDAVTSAHQQAKSHGFFAPLGKQTSPPFGIFKLG